MRLVDVDAALRARSYADGEPVVLEVTDELCPWNEGRYRVGEGAGSVQGDTRSSRSTSPTSPASTSAPSTSTGSCTPVERGSCVTAPPRRASQLFRTDLPPYTPEEF